MAGILILALFALRLLTFKGFVGQSIPIEV